MQHVTGDRAEDDALAAFFEAVFAASEGEEEGALIGGLVRDILATTADRDLHVFTTRDGDVLVGAGIFTRLDFPEEDRTVFILAPMAVATARQGQGIGQGLLTHALDALRAAGVDVAVTYGDPAYYGKVGFAPIAEDTAKAPQPLRFPQGWLAQSLTAQPLERLRGQSHCVTALNDPAYW